MKKLIFMCAILVAPLMAEAQYSSKITEAYTQAEIDAIVAQDPNELLFLEFMAEHATSVQKMRGDLSALPDISTLNALAKNENIAPVSAENFDLETFNPLAYNLDLEHDMPQYRLGDSDRVLQVLSKPRARHLFDNGLYPH